MTCDICKYVYKKRVYGDIGLCPSCINMLASDGSQTDETHFDRIISIHDREEESQWITN